MWDYVMFSFTQMTWHTQKHLIDAKENDLILAFDFPFLEGVCDESRLRGRQLHTASCQNKVQTY